MRDNRSLYAFLKQEDRSKNSLNLEILAVADVKEDVIFNSVLYLP